MQTGNPRVLYCYAAFRVDYGTQRDSETDCHVALSDYHVRGEWFEHDNIDHIVDILSCVLKSKPMSKEDVLDDIYYRATQRDYVKHRYDNSYIMYDDRIEYSDGTIKYFDT